MTLVWHYEDGIPKHLSTRYLKLAATDSTATLNEHQRFILTPSPGELYLFCLKKKKRKKSEPSLSRCKLVALVLYWSRAYLV